MDLLLRRPCTLKDISASLQIHPNEALKHLDELVKNGKLKFDLQNGVNYYAVLHSDPDHIKCINSPSS